MTSRRVFVKGGAAAMTGVLLPQRVRAALANSYDPRGWTQVVREVVAPADIAARALEAAKTAGANYADVCIVATLGEDWSFMTTYQPPQRGGSCGIGVRALVNGHWGFVGCDGLVGPDEAVTMGREATQQAQQAAAVGRPRSVDLGQMPVARGHWTTPIQIDPFAVTFEEKVDYVNATKAAVQRLHYGVGTRFDLNFARTDTLFASTEGALATQTLYTTGGVFVVRVPADWTNESSEGLNADFLSHAGAGWEYILNAPVLDRSPELIDQALRLRRTKPIDIGRYDVVVNAKLSARLLAATIGAATPLDRIMGYRANDEGTSYIHDPLSALGSLSLAAPLITVTSDRTTAQGVATVKWDAEGVEPRNTTLVSQGILTDVQTTRESSAWIALHYEKNHMPTGSNGCAGIVHGGEPVRYVRPNLALKPAATNDTFDDLVKNTKQGLAFCNSEVIMDHQVMSGLTRNSIVYRIVDGQLAEPNRDVEMVVRSLDLWHNVVAIGGERSAVTFGLDDVFQYSVSAVPLQIKNVAVIDPRRRA